MDNVKTCEFSRYFCDIFKQSQIHHSKHMYALCMAGYKY